MLNAAKMAIGEQDIGQRPGGDDQRALPQRLRLEGLRALLGRQAKPFLARLARRVHVAGELHVAAERQQPKASSACRACR